MTRSASITSPRHRVRLAGLCALFLFSLVMNAADTGPAGLNERFDAANKLYEQGKFGEAAFAFDSLLNDGLISPVLLFNLGNAHFKANQAGQAVAAYRMGLELAPRDPALRFNLQFVRKQITGQETPPGVWYRRWLSGLTLNEWTVLFVVPFWVWFLLLSLQQVDGSWRKLFRGYTTSAGIASGVMLFCLLNAFLQKNGDQSAVVVTPEAIVRYGPLEESQVNFQLPDGSEVEVLDEQISDQTWFLVRDANNREGWLRDHEVRVLR